MKNIFYQLIFISLFFCNHIPAQSVIDSTELSLAKKLFDEADIIYDKDPMEAIRLLKEALPHYYNSKSWEEYISCNNYLATACFYNNLFEENEAYTKAAFSTANKYFPPDHRVYGMTLHNLSTFYHNRGDFDKSYEILREALEIKLKNKVNLFNIAYTYNNLGTILTKKGDYEKALSYLKKGLEIRLDTFLKSPSPYLAQELFNCRNNIAWAYQKKGNLNKALQNFEECLLGLKKFKQSKDANQNLFQREIIFATHRIANVYIELENYNQAKKHLKEVLSYQELTSSSYRKSASLNSLGQIHFAENNLDEATTQYNKALDLIDQYEPTNLALKAQVLGNLAKARIKSDQIEMALAAYQQGLKVLAPGFTASELNSNPSPSKLYSKLDALELLSGKGEVLWAQYQKSKDPEFLKQSEETFTSCLEVVTAIRQDILTPEAKNALSEKTISIHEGAIRAVLEKYQLTNNEVVLADALVLAERNKSLLLLESINEQAALEVKDLPDSLLHKDKSLRLEIAFYQKQIIETGSDRGKTKNLENQLFNLKNDLQSLTDHFEENYPRFHQLKYQNEVADLNAIQNHLSNQQQAIIEYFVGEEKTYAFVIWANGCEVFEVKNQTNIFDAVQLLKSSIEQLPEDAAAQQNYDDFTSAAHYLYQQILEPALNLLPKDIRNIKIIPDYHLNHVPFDLLLTKKAPREPYFSTENLEYVLENYNISYDYSATWILKNQDNGSRDYSADFIAFAPSFKKATDIANSRSCTSGDLYNLSCSEEEVQGIQSVFGGDLRLNNFATKTNFEKEAASYKVLHMATHACVDEANPLFNKIFLTDDYLSNADLYNTSLNAELVVLSACNTGSGKLVKGEGVLSIARGFVQAGCASSIVSRWSVDDCATSDIMQSMYKELKAGKRKDEALRLAKLSYLEKGDAFTSHPYYWSAFVGYGDMVALEGSGWSWKWALWGGIILIGIGLLFKKYASIDEYTHAT